MNFLDTLYYVALFIFVGYVIGMKHHEYMMKRKINQYVQIHESIYYNSENILSRMNDKEELQRYIRNLEKGDDNERN